MSFRRETIVKNPRKKYFCYVCDGELNGEHLYIAGVHDGGFDTMRLHIECDTRCQTMCANCPYGNDCQSDLAECYQEKVIKGDN